MTKEKLGATANRKGHSSYQKKENRKGHSTRLLKNIKKDGT
jgi:hypothetical protein